MRININHLDRELHRLDYEPTVLPNRFIKKSKQNGNQEKRKISY
jgi:hypothetical protein